MRLSICLLAIFTCCKKSLNSSRPVASLGPTFGQVFNFFSKLVLIIAGLPKRSLRILRASWYALSGSCTRYWSCSTTLLALPSKYWYKRCNFCLAVTGAESIRLSKAFSHKKNLVLSKSFPSKTSGVACGSRCNWLIFASASVSWVE